MYGQLKPIGGGTAIKLSRTRMLLGRSRHCDIVISYPQVSGDHCELFYQEGHWHVRDLNSRNGTKVNGHLVRGEELLEPGDVLTVAHYSYEVDYTVDS